MTISIDTRALRIAQEIRNDAHNADIPPDAYARAVLIAVCAIADDHDLQGGWYQWVLFELDILHAEMDEQKRQHGRK